MTITVLQPTCIQWPYQTLVTNKWSKILLSNEHDIKAHNSKIQLLQNFMWDVSSEVKIQLKKYSQVERPKLKLT